jgi:AcrR family transcriptional regulator
MPRLRADLSGKRLRDLLDAALVVFCRQGFERSQVADVAKAMGVAVGTVYLYVESKEALFDLVVRFSVDDNPQWLDEIEVPAPTPPAGSTVEFLRTIFGRHNQWPVLDAALATRRIDDPKTELAEVLREQYRLMTRHRMGLILLMRSTLEFPGLEDVFVLGLRNKLLTHLERYLVMRIEGGQLRKVADVSATAAVLIQTIVWANLQRPFDRGLASLSDEAIENAVVDTLVHGLLA